MTPEEVVRANFDAYVRQDRAAAEALIGEQLSFTSPQDDHIDRDAFFEHCFPTADRFSRQELVHVAPAGAGDVFVMYEYDLGTGGTYRNTELVTVADGRIVEIQVFFGGAVR
jgi:ketosteroid isomerase-like protein